MFQSKLKNPDTGNAQSSNDSYNVVAPLAKQLFKTWAHVFDDLFDLDGDGKLNEYEGKLFLASILQKEISLIQTSQLSDNPLKWNLVNMSKKSFIENANKLNRRKRLMTRKVKSRTPKKTFQILPLTIVRIRLQTCLLRKRRS